MKIHATLIASNPTPPPFERMIDLNDVEAVRDWYTNSGFYYPQITALGEKWQLTSFDDYAAVKEHLGLPSPSRNILFGTHYESIWKSFGGTCDPDPTAP